MSQELIAILGMGVLVLLGVVGTWRAVWRESERIRAEASDAHEKIGKRIDGVNERLGKRIDGVNEKLGKRIDGVDERLGKRIDGVDERLGKRIDGVNEELGKRIDGVDERLGKRIDGVNANLVNLSVDVGHFRGSTEEQIRQLQATAKTTSADVATLTTRLAELSGAIDVITRLATKEPE